MLRLVLIILTAALASGAFAQTNITLGAINADPNAPVEITADNLTVDQATGVAVFEGNVVIGQAELRLSAARVQVIYDGASGDITRLAASGGVTFATTTEAAEAQTANYDLVAGTLVLEGEVLVTQGNSAISGDRMRVDLDSGNTQIEGRVRTIFNQGGN